MKKIICMVLILSICPQNSVFAQDNLYRSVLEREVEIMVKELYIRTGPGTQYQTIGTVVKGDVLQVLGALGGWYVVCLADGSIGVVYGGYVKARSVSTGFMPQGDLDGDYPDTEAGTVVGLANAARMENGLTLFEWDEQLNRIAQLKAEDMRRNGYFGHYSEVYGTPFAMLKQLGVAYRSASENIAGSITIENAVVSIMSSPSHRSNVLSGRFNKMGVGIVDDEKYGKIVVQMFIQE